MRTRRGAIDFLTREELRVLLDAARTKSPRDYCMILLAYRHGLRASEICGLKTEDIDRQGGHILCRRGKGSITNWQQMGAEEISAVSQWVDRRGQLDTPWLFPGRPPAKPVSRQHFHGIIRAVGRRAHVSPAKCHPHALKHSIGTHLANAGVPVQVIQQRLGHRSISNTMIYLSIASQYVDNAVATAIEAGAVI